MSFSAATDLIIEAKLPSLLRVCGLLLGLAFLLHRAFAAFKLERRRQAIKIQHGVVPPPWLPQNPLLRGFDSGQEQMTALKDHGLLELIQNRFLQMGCHTFQLLLMNRWITITLEPENLKTIQAIDNKKWYLSSERKISFAPFLGTGIFTSDGDDWQHSRNMLRPNFSRSQIDNMEDLETHVTQLLSQIPANGVSVDLSDLFFRFTMDTATELLFGESTNSLSRGSGQGFADAFSRSQSEAFYRSTFGPFYRLFSRKKQTVDDYAFCHSFVDYYVQKGLKERQNTNDQKTTSNNERYIFLEELVRQTDDPIRIRSELLNILLAGRDTTASLLTNVWHILCQRPDIWQKLQTEVSDMLGTQPPLFSEVKNLRYLRAILNESLRLHPVVPINTREAIEDTTLPRGGGLDGQSPIFIKKGQLVTWSLYSMHRRKDLFGPDAEEFRPERWLDDPNKQVKAIRPTWEYLPFNGGARICLGQQLALTEAAYLTTRLCQVFDRIESRGPKQWEESIQLTCVNNHGAKVGLYRRDETA